MNGRARGASGPLPGSARDVHGRTRDTDDGALPPPVPIRPTRSDIFSGISHNIIRSAISGTQNGGSQVALTAHTVRQTLEFPEANFDAVCSVDQIPYAGS